MQTIIVLLIEESVKMNKNNNFKKNNNYKNKCQIMNIVG